MPDSFSRQNPSCALINLSFVRALNAAVMSGLMMLLIYRLSIKSFYNLKNILQRQLMRYLNQVFFLCTQYLSKFLITLDLCISGILVMKEVLLNEPLTFQDV